MLLNGRIGAGPHHSPNRNRPAGLGLAGAETVGPLVHDVERAGHAHFAQVAAADQLDHAAIVGPEWICVPTWQMRRAAARRCARPGFRPGERHGLLDVEVLARLAGVDRLQGVPVGRRGDDHRVDVCADRAIAGSRRRSCRFWAPRPRPSRSGPPPHVAGGGDDHVGLYGAHVQVGRAHAAATDDPQADLLAGRRLVLGSQRRGGHVGSRCRGCGGLKKLARSPATRRRTAFSWQDSDKETGREIERLRRHGNAPPAGKQPVEDLITRRSTVTP